MMSGGGQDECHQSGLDQGAMEMPKIMYGTAWKAEKTDALVMKALRAGFRGIDTACQPKHYNEPGVGAGVQKGMAELGLRREDLFLQSKYTPIRGQDPNKVPYDKGATIPIQVQQSVRATLKNLGTEYMDSILLHSPLPTHGETLEAWRELEKFVAQGVIRRLGISNCYELHAFEQLFNDASVKPTVLQNRFYQDSGYDVELREFCLRNNVTYQSFWTLTGNPHLLKSKAVQAPARRLGATCPQVLFRFVSGLGVVPLTGTTDEEHMLQDLAALQLELTAEEARGIAAQLR